MLPDEIIFQYTRAVAIFVSFVAFVVFSAHSLIRTSAWVSDHYLYSFPNTDSSSAVNAACAHAVFVKQAVVGAEVYKLTIRLSVYVNLWRMQVHTRWQAFLPILCSRVAAAKNEIRIFKFNCHLFCGEAVGKTIAWFFVLTSWCTWTAEVCPS